MVTREVKPLNEGSARRSRSRMTWIGIAAIALFFVILAFVVFRPIVDRRDGAEREVPQVTRPAITETGP